MKQISQAPATDPVPAVGTADPASGDETLSEKLAERDGLAMREELVKWRERVPKLAAALRQRADETTALKQELERLKSLQGAGQNPAAGIRARDELIAELEGKLADLAKRHKAAQGELHERKLEVDELKTDLETWKGKWQSVTRALDEQAAQVSDRTERSEGLEQVNEDLGRRLDEETAARAAIQRVLDEVTEERDSLRRRNEQLFETTELANRQMGSLTNSLVELRVSLRQYRERETERAAERETSQAELDALRANLQSLSAQAEEAHALAERRSAERDAALLDREEATRLSAEAERRLRAAVEAGERARRTVRELTEELHLMSVAAASGVNAAAQADGRVAAAERARQEAEQRLSAAEREQAGLQFAVDEHRREVKRLTDVVEMAQLTTREREKERRDLSLRLQAMEARAEHLEQQLAERSALVVTLEQDRVDSASVRQVLEQERDEQEAARMRAERHVKESAEHITQLDAKLERQKELMESLEEELAEAREEQAQAAYARHAEHREAEPEIHRLQEQVRKLETLVRERTEAVNRLEWQQSLASESSAGGNAHTSHLAVDVDGKTLLVLNQQLNDARTRNDELRARIRSLETELEDRKHVAAQHSDDLTRIHGVGQKLAEQLNELGVHRYQQIAELDEADLADENHVLHGHRGRILRDGWIEQAVKLISH